MSEQSREGEQEPRFGAPQKNGDPFQGEDAVEVDADLQPITDDPASQTDAGEADAAGQTTNKPGEDPTVEVPKERLAKIIEQVQAQGREITELKEELNSLHKVVDRNVQKRKELEKRVDENQGHDDYSIFLGDTKVDRVAKLVLRNFDNLATRNAITTGGRGSPGVTKELNKRLDDGDRVQSATVHRALEKIGEKFVEYRFDEGSENEPKRLIKEGDN